MKTFRQLINEIHGTNVYQFDISDTLSLMEFVRRETLKECAKKATLTMHITEGEIIVDERSILSLDKNSLDV